MARPSARRVLPGTATLVTLLLLDGACRTAAAEVVEKVASSLNLPPPPPPAPSPPPALEVSPEALDAAPIRDTLTIIDENKQSSLSPLTPHEKLVEHAIEVETDPIRSTLSHSEVLKDIVERDRRPPWLSNVLQGFGLRVWVDESLCYMLNWACPEPPKFIDSEFGQVYFWALVSANIFVVLLLVSVLGGWLAHVCDPMPRVYRERREQLKQRPLTVLLPCYLPNECEIMDDTIEHMMLELEYDYPFTLIVCYNTPEPMEKEELPTPIIPAGRLDVCAACVDASEAGPADMALVTPQMYAHIRDVTAPLVFARPQHAELPLWNADEVRRKIVAIMRV